MDIGVNVILVAFLNFTVDLLLLLGTSRLCEYSVGWKRVIMAAAIGGIYGGACLLPGFRYLQNVVWRLVSYGLICWTAFGWDNGMLRRCAVFILLSVALSGISEGLGSANIWALLIPAGCLCTMCLLVSLGRVGSRAYLPVVVSYNGRSVHLTALQDTGNSLRDPMTGRPVLIIGADAAAELTGLTKQQLHSPAETVCEGCLPGLRLIPYKTIGRSDGLLLALKIHDVKIGSWKGSSLVAFAPEALGVEGRYQALTGGMV